MLALVTLTLTALPLAAQDHAQHAMSHQGMPELRPIPDGALHTAADVQFMQGMIAHHGQAIHMSRLADERGSDARVIRFAKKIDQSQIAEIALMQGWLHDHGQVAPDTAAYHSIMMNGMLTREELAELASVRGAPFDKRFLELMIRHHEGALQMVAELLATPGAAQEVDVSVLANDIDLVQSAEIDLMRQMLAHQGGEAPALIPLPAVLHVGSGTFSFRDTVVVTIAPATPRMREIAGVLVSALAEYGITARLRETPDGSGGINLGITDSRPGDESYRLVVTTAGVRVDAPAEAGVLWGVQTLRQLMHRRGSDWQVAAVDISDTPRFGWRGTMLDVGRHLFPVEYILEHLDWMSRYKLNVFHWHLTEDQGWRLAIDALPRLTAVGGWRVEADGSRYGGWYSKDEVRQVVERARVLGITVVPEIEMPGHARAALAAYPELGCTSDTLPVPSTWGVFTDVLCPGKESTFTFLETVLGEVLELFPSRYIHIGGDEVPKQRWEACPSCQEIIRREGLGDEHGLQRWMIARIGRWLDARGRVLIGWDEILDGGLPPGAVVQAWQGSDRITKALEAGADVIASPAEWVYLNRPASELTLDRVVQFDPGSSAVSARGGRILGGEAPLWTEHVTSPANAELMWWPRLLGFAETMWHGPADPASFRARVEPLAAGMRAAGVAVGPADHALVSLRFRFDSSSNTIRVTHDGATTGLQLLLESDEHAARPVHDGDPMPGTGVWRLSARWNGEQVGEQRTIAVTDHLAVGKSIRFATPADPRYPGTGLHTLVDGARGTAYNDGFWNGWLGPDLDAAIDLGEVRVVHTVELSLLEQVNTWILHPETVELYRSTDGRDWRLVDRRVTERTVVPDATSRELVAFELPRSIRTRWVRVVARGGRRLPGWHSGAGELAWIFADEIQVR